MGNFGWRWRIRQDCWCPGGRGKATASNGGAADCAKLLLFFCKTYSTVDSKKWKTWSWKADGYNASSLSWRRRASSKLEKSWRLRVLSFWKKPWLIEWEEISEEETAKSEQKFRCECCLLQKEHSEYSTKADVISCIWFFVSDPKLFQMEWPTVIQQRTAMRWIE